MAHVLASDDFIEFHQRPTGVITGVAYQTGPLNDARLRLDAHARSCRRRR